MPNFQKNSNRKPEIPSLVCSNFNNTVLYSKIIQGHSPLLQFLHTRTFSRIRTVKSALSLKLGLFTAYSIIDISSASSQKIRVKI